MPAGSSDDRSYLIRPEILAGSAGCESPRIGFTRLDAIENPWSLPVEAASKIEALCRVTPLNRYPDPCARELKTVLHGLFEWPPGTDIVLGNGSDEIIQMIVMALSRPGAACLTLVPGAESYRRMAGLMGMKFFGVPLRDDFTVDEAAFFSVMHSELPALIIIGRPNNPTGNLFSRNFIFRVIEEAPGLVVLDEACLFFNEDSFIPAIDTFPNLLVIRSLSGIGLAGLRLGFVCGADAWIGQLEKLRLPYNIGILTQQLAMMVLRDYAHLLEEQTILISKQRQRLQKALTALPGLIVFPSDAGFVLFRAVNSQQLFEALLEQKISIRSLHGKHPLLEDCLRVTVGSPMENLLFLSTLTKILEHRNESTQAAHSDGQS